MKILAVGGGSGGHVTPIAAVLKSLYTKDSSLIVEVWTDKAFLAQASAKIHAVNDTISIKTVSSGKLRRYHNVATWRQVFRVRTIVIPNLIDAFKIGVGFLQSLYRLSRNRPDIIFCKGGFVCLPVGLAAKVLGLPVVLHDSDAHPGLTNRVLSRSAIRIGTGAPLKYYNYNPAFATYIGTPIDERFNHHYSDAARKRLKQQLGFDANRPLVVVTGGGLGAQSMNKATVAILPELLQFSSVLLISGQSNYAQLASTVKSHDASKYQLKAFVATGMVEVLAAADIVVARAGATTLLELAALGKPTIIVPNPYLTGGHQLKNARVYEETGAAAIVGEQEMVANPNSLLDCLNALVLNPKALKTMSLAMRQFSRPNAANDMADLIIDAVKTTSTK